MAGDEHVTSARAVYDASAEWYLGFVGTELSSATEDAVDRSLLVAFGELVAELPPAPVADVGCGPGRVAALLSRLGVDVVGIDVSTAMLAAARSAHPQIPFEEGRLDRLPFVDGSLSGVVCWYSIIYTPPQHLDRAFAEASRVLRPGGQVLLAFQAGAGEGVERVGAQGTTHTLTSYRHGVDDVTDRLEAAGFEVHTTALRVPRLDHESAHQAFVIGSRR